MVPGDRPSLPARGCLAATPSLEPGTEVSPLGARHTHCNITDTRRKQRYDFSKRLLANTRGENGEETTKDPRNPFTPCAFAAWAASKPISSSKPISRHHRKQRKTGLPRTAFRADSNALITPQNMKNMKLDVNSYADHACGARRAPETTPRPSPAIGSSPAFCLARRLTTRSRTVAAPRVPLTIS